MSSKQQTKYWVFVEHSSEVPKFDALCMEYMIYQREKCPDTGKLHYQGFVVFSGRHRLGGVKKVMPTAHLEPMRGTVADNIKYCSKEESRVEPTVEHGTRPTNEQGKRTDLDHLVELIKGGETTRSIAEQLPKQIILHSRGINQLQAYYHKNPTSKFGNFTVEVHYGESGTGKTKQAFDRFPDLYTYPYLNGFFWEGYTDQDTVLLDEFPGKQECKVPLSLALKWLDIYPMILNQKGANVKNVFTRVIITSNMNPQDWYPSDDYAPLERRLHKIVFYSKGVDPVVMKDTTVVTVTEVVGNTEPQLTSPTNVSYSNVGKSRMPPGLPTGTPSSGGVVNITQDEELVIVRPPKVRRLTVPRIDWGQEREDALFETLMSDMDKELK